MHVFNGARNLINHFHFRGNPRPSGRSPRSSPVFFSTPCQWARGFANFSGNAVIAKLVDAKRNHLPVPHPPPPSPALLTQHSVRVCPQKKHPRKRSWATIYEGFSIFPMTSGPLCHIAHPPAPLFAGRRERNYQLIHHKIAVFCQTRRPSRNSRRVRVAGRSLPRTITFAPASRMIKESPPRARVRPSFLAIPWWPNPRSLRNLPLAKPNSLGWAFSGRPI